VHFESVPDDQRLRVERGRLSQGFRTTVDVFSTHGRCSARTVSTSIGCWTLFATVTRPVPQAHNPLVPLYHSTLTEAALQS